MARRLKFPESRKAARQQARTNTDPGAIARAAVAGLWRQALPQLSGVRRLDLGGVHSVDSAGLALLAELSARCGGAVVEGLPDGLGDLRAAYRLDETLAFAR